MENLPFPKYDEKYGSKDDYNELASAFYIDDIHDNKGEGNEKNEVGDRDDKNG